MKSLIAAMAVALPLTTLSLASFAASGPKRLEADGIAVQAETIVGGLEHPWGLEFLPDGGAIVTERPGRMRLISPQGALSDPIEGVPKVQARSQGGLLDVTIAPDFAQSGTIFFTYLEPGRGGAGIALARARLMREGGTARLHDVKVIFRVGKKTSGRINLGSRVVVMPDGKLMVTTGDTGDADRAQDMKDDAGAVIRVNTDGSIPADNPSPDGSKWLPEIWSKGHRNAQGAVYDPVTKGLITVEHGARGGDEVNRPEAGKNYGWPVITYGADYSGAKIGIGTAAPGYEQPLFYWDPSIAPSGLAVYEGNMFPEWRGDLLVGALKYQLVSRLDRDEKGNILGEHRMFEGEFGRIRDVKIASDGSIWLLTDEEDGAVIRILRR
ncbi:PQQ-dependent sugar dehydrogenase [Mesorhizobium sp. BAC0120]|uniref:PQQ-dependent sugar dehydrogenase n=1 Tax=Mesorhizobium sp. BAC0120 TaxID=3090670 RepID=UPI00298D0890|nr:PQQ-dependent sugar dehydrogenase [Mesorhizobium sp. BAC0120]MDW6022373.1 PQQ-dependent sugar dehydrogenase [Mesorhizobium sp. BAC0120]